jgi:hypothetical protein
MPAIAVAVYPLVTVPIAATVMAIICTAELSPKTLSPTRETPE